MTAPPSDPPATEIPTCYRHPTRETWIRCTRCDRPICPDCMRDAAVGFQCPACVAAGSRGGRQARTALGGRLRSGTPVVWTLIGLNVAVFVATALGGTSIGFAGGRSDLYAQFANTPLSVAIGGEYYRLLTAMFLHFGVLHILFNMLALYYVGVPLERSLGRLRLLGLYLLAGLGGSVASFLFGPLGAQSAGASGAVFGLFGAFFVVSRRLGGETGPIVTLIVVNLVLSVAVPGIDLRGHLGGLVTGALLAAILAYVPGGRWRSASQVVGFTAVAVLLAALTVVRTGDLRQRYTCLDTGGGQVTCAPATAAATATTTTTTTVRPGPALPGSPGR